MFPSKTFTVLGLVFWSLIHFELIFKSFVVGIHFFACGYPVSQQSLLNKLLSPLNPLNTLVNLSALNTMYIYRYFSHDVFLTV